MQTLSTRLIKAATPLYGAPAAETGLTRGSFKADAGHLFDHMGSTQGR